MKKRKCCKSTGPHSPNCRHTRRTCGPSPFSVVASVPANKAEASGRIMHEKITRFLTPKRGESLESMIEIAGEKLTRE